MVTFDALSRPASLAWTLSQTTILECSIQKNVRLWHSSRRLIFRAESVLVRRMGRTEDISAKYLRQAGAVLRSTATSLGTPATVVRLSGASH